jgi:uncharacterized protein
MMAPDVGAHLAGDISKAPVVQLPGQLVQRIRKQADAECVPYDSIAKLPPVFQVETLSLVDARRDGLDASYAIDAMVAAIGHAAKKKVVSLETPESQLKVLLMHSPQEAIALIGDDLDELESGEGRNYLKQIAGYWNDSNFEKMSHYQDWCECLDTDVERKFMKRLLDDRNSVLAERIDRLHMSGKQVFVAVGSLHMFGPAGLPALMEKRGYKVERVDFKPQ